MSHLIDESNNRANMAYIGETPWHGLGQKVNPDATIEEWQIAAGLDWHIQKRPVLTSFENADGTLSPQVIENRFAHVRSDTQAVLGLGSDKFQLIQPSDTLEFYRDLVEGSRFTIETAGALNGGAKLWALARANVDLTLGGNDVLKPYLLLATANDGSMSTVADFTTVRVVCQNTLSMAVGRNGSKAAIKVPHSRQFDAYEVKSQLGLIDDRLETFAADADSMTQVRVTDKQAVNFFADLYGKYDADGELLNRRSVEPTVNKIMDAFKNGPGADLPTANGTVWGMMNGLTNYLDYDTAARSDDNRFSSGQFGNNAKLKARAFEKAIEYVELAAA